jgi:hypothetical protein
VNMFLKKINFEENKFIFLLAAIKFLLHMITGWQYGYFRDEFYYFAMSEHLDFGYVDVSPIAPLFMKLTRLLFGDSVFAIHIFPALSGAITLFLAALIARKLGGGRFSQILTALAVMVAPTFYVFGSMFSYDCFDQLVSTIFIFLLISMWKQEDNPKAWIAIGVVAGIGLMVKISFMFLVFSLIVALLLTHRRKVFSSKWIWLGGIVALLLLLPYIVWQATHGAFILEYWTEYAKYKVYKTSPISYLITQIVMLNPLNFPLWIAGLWFLLSGEKGKPFRVLGWMNLIYLLLSMIMSFKFYLMASTYVPVLSAGAVSVESHFAKGKIKNVFKHAYVALIVAMGMLLFPIFVPVIPVEKMIDLYSKVSKRGVSIKTENIKTVELPQHFADRFGWEELVKTVANVYHGISSEERKNTAIFGVNYGEAGAIDLLGAKYGLPKSIGGHLSYYVWGLGDFNGESIIIVGKNYKDEKVLKEMFEEVEIKAVTNAKYAIPYENNKPVYLCKKLKVPLKEVWWPAMKNMN